MLHCLVSRTRQHMKLRVKCNSSVKCYVKSEDFKGKFCSTFMTMPLILSKFTLGRGMCHPVRVRVDPLQLAWLRRLFILVQLIALKALTNFGDKDFFSVATRFFLTPGELSCRCVCVCVCARVHVSIAVPHV